MLEDENGVSRRVTALAQPAVLLFGMLLGGLTWGIKLEIEHSEDRKAWVTESTALRERVKELEGRIGNGILPRTQSEIDDLKRDMRELHSTDQQIFDRLVNCERITRQR